MPPKSHDLGASWEDVASGVRLPVWHCAFEGCGWHSDSNDVLVNHLDVHSRLFTECRGSGCFANVYSNMDLYEEAIACIERDQFPLVGPSVDRRCIEMLTREYNDDQIHQLICFVCGQSKTRTPGKHSEIERQNAGWLVERGPETLEANLGWKT